MNIECQDICKHYGRKTVLDHFSCVIPEGSVTAVMAPSGAGKTTLLRILLGLEEPDAGCVSGVPTEKSVLFQENRLFSALSAAGNLKMVLGKTVPESRIREILAELGLGASPDTPASQLSGGMARRTALARALLHPGKLIVLDEPFTGLDEENRLAAAAVIRKYRSGRTLIFVTHREEDLTLLDASACIRPGEAIDKTQTSVL